MNADHDITGPFEFHCTRELILRLRPDTDLVESLTKLARDEGIEAATFTAIGALKEGRLGYYDQIGQYYWKIRIDSRYELASCVGNISLKDGEPFVHAHAVVSNEKGETRAGHLLEGIVFAVEVHLRQLEGPRLERKYDEPTALMLWTTE